ncbi:hypothetical protein diail_6820 [Diaporthe ilicicola]|nr:hypothetical protein diail_6820 [Diaporthe ilicicola]
MEHNASKAVGPTKVDEEFIEQAHDSNPFLTLEDAEFMRRYEGRAGGKVARKAGLFSGVVYIVSTWYSRHELQQSIEIFYTASAFSGDMSGLLAFGIARLDGARGIAGWRWIFLLEGAIPVAAGIMMSDDEKRFVHLRLRMSGVRANTEEGDKFSWRMLVRVMFDWKVILCIIMAWANSVPNVAFKLTMPQIIQQLDLDIFEGIWDMMLQSLTNCVIESLS